MGDKSIISEEKLSRIYPQKNLFSHIIGQIDNDNNGISGIEKSFDQELKRTKKTLRINSRYRYSIFNKRRAFKISRNF